MKKNSEPPIYCVAEKYLRNSRSEAKRLDGVDEKIILLIDKKEYDKLKAMNWVLKDSQLRTYDGLTDKADKYDAMVKELELCKDQLQWSLKNEQQYKDAFRRKYDELEAYKKEMEEL